MILLTLMTCTLTIGCAMAKSVEMLGGFSFVIGVFTVGCPSSLSLVCSAEMFFAACLNTGYSANLYTLDGGYGSFKHPRTVDVHHAFWPHLWTRIGAGLGWCICDLHYLARCILARSRDAGR